MKPVFALLFILFAFSLAEWQSVTRNYTLFKPKQYIGNDYSIDTVAIKYNVTCSEICTVILFDYQNFEKFKLGEKYEFVARHINTTKAIFEFSDRATIKKRMILVTINEFEEEPTARFKSVNNVTMKLEQLMNRAKAIDFAYSSILKERSDRECSGSPFECCRLGPRCFDPAGLIYRVWLQEGKVLPKYISEYPSGGFKVIPKIDEKNLWPGDILYSPDHIGLYVGNSAVIHVGYQFVEMTSLEMYSFEYRPKLAYRV